MGGNSKNDDDGGMEGDTLYIASLPEKGLNDQVLITFYDQIPGFRGLRYDDGTTGKGGPKCFLRFEDPAAAENAKQLTDKLSPEVQPALARTSLKLHQATYVKA